LNQRNINNEKGFDLEDYRTHLRTVGSMLIIVGLIDMAYMLYCIVQHVSYSSSFNIFAIIAGIFLVCGNLKSARIIAKLIAMLIALLFGFLATVPFLFSVDLLRAYAHLAPDRIAMLILPWTIEILLIVLYNKLTAPPVLAAMDEAKINYQSFWRSPASGFWIGGIGAVLIAAMVIKLTTGTTADLAKQRVTTQLGDGYKLHVTSLHISAGLDVKHIHAVVTAWNQKEIKDIAVDWSE